ncbi:DUF2795 domain-containing protein [Candidatus Nitrosocosmicus arcticus]|uniref:DUF2795 domain-containing protein n=1 Tax=Candidatus Nitrosocosmicus arcticus TaxID=2035267 RepID=A0A557SXZ6_9ARCH|nr:DUF2795 domain-containing protein [Candidatus Nitrosocosmicus arcticus]TVP41484.1 hypothetical protein NARC_30199 [Candidatus Nitrosocosmicus arcticus]
MNTSYNNEKKEQIPKEDGPEGQTGKFVSQQNAIEGQRKEVSVESYSTVAELGQVLKDLDFPVEKSKVLEFIRQHQSIQNKDKILSSLSSLEEKSYNNVSEITMAAGLVY